MTVLTSDTMALSVQSLCCFSYCTVVSLLQNRVPGTNNNNKNTIYLEESITALTACNHQ